MALFDNRSLGTEIMDDLDCAGEVVRQTLRELDVINRWLGGNRVTVDGYKKLIKQHDLKKPLIVADIGCGSGELLKIIKKVSPQESSFFGIDANKHIVAYAQQHVVRHSEIKIMCEDILSSPFQQKEFDVIIATLFLHHFSSDQLIAIFNTALKQTRVGLVVNDLHRHWFAYYSIKFLTSIFSKSHMVRHDAPLSVLRGFKRSELEEILNRAGIHKYALSWKWAFRWQLIIPSRQK
jgi:SAM-dependent methyltransferase